MTLAAHIASYLAGGLLGLSAHDRFSALQKSGNTDVTTSSWFTIVLVIVLAASAAGLIGVSLYKGVKELKARKKKDQVQDRPASPAASRGVTAATPDAAAVVGEAAPVTRETTPANKSEPEEKTAAETEIALFPFSKKFDVDDGNDERFLDFWPAAIKGVEGKVIFLETPFSAGVGDRVLVVINLVKHSEGPTQELIEDAGVVRQIQPADSANEPDEKRLAVELTGLTDAQVAELDDFIKRVTAKAEITAGAGVN